MKARQKTRVSEAAAHESEQSGSGRKSGRDQSTPVNTGRHEYHCTICSHAKREEIERSFLNWTSPSRISEQYSVSRDSIYRHAHALGLMDKRRRNIRAALEQIIEREIGRASCRERV